MILRTRGPESSQIYNFRPFCIVCCCLLHFFLKADRYIILIKITQNVKHNSRTLVMGKHWGLRDSFSCYLKICLEKQHNLLDFGLSHVI